MPQIAARSSQLNLKQLVTYEVSYLSTRVAELNIGILFVLLYLYHLCCSRCLPKRSSVVTSAH